MHTKKITALAAIGGIAALIPSGCAAPPGTGDGGGATASDFLPCAVSDLTGFDDNDFDELTYNGVVAAADKLGVGDEVFRVGIRRPVRRQHREPHRRGLRLHRRPSASRRPTPPVTPRRSTPA